MWKKVAALGGAALMMASLSACGSSAASSAPKAEAKAETRTSAAAPANGKAVVVYFSATGNTKRAAQLIANAKGADIWEIQAQEPYTDADLNYRDNSSRCVREHNDRSIKPAIAGDVPGWDSYTTVFLGYPIWWGEAPNIVYHFAETHDFTGKRVIPFCTSVSSGVGESDTLLAQTAKTGDWLGGTQFYSRVGESELVDWAKRY